MEFTRPEGKQRDAIKELGELKLVNEGLEKRISHMRNTIIERNTEYERVFDYNKRRKKVVETLERKVETLEKKVKLSEEIREAETAKFVNDLAKEKKKVKDERNEKKKMKEELSGISDRNIDNRRKIDELEEELSKMKNGNELQVSDLTRHIQAYEERVYDKDLEIMKLRDEMTKQENKHQDFERKRDKDMQVLNERLQNRYKELIEAKKDLVDAGKQLRKTLETLKSCDRREDAAER